MGNRFLKFIPWLLFVLSFQSFGYFKPQFLQRNIPNELQGFKSGLGSNSSYLLEYFKTSQLRFRSKRGGAIDLLLEGAKPFAFSGMPKVPQLFRMFKIEQGKSAEAHLENVVLEETSFSVPIAKAPEAYVWSLARRRMGFRKRGNERYFPGRLVQSYQINGNLWVSLFPVQVDLHTGKVLKVASAEIKVAYSEKPVQLSLGEIFSKPSLIVTSKGLKAAAELLKNYHEEKLGVKTEVVTVEEIDQTESMIAEENLPDGYKDPSERNNFVKPYDSKTGKGYNYELAKKISNYLQRRIGDSSPLKYVTILGDSQAVPPSYYFAYSSTQGRNFTPTDVCYGAVKECLDPKVAVGRLPLQNEEQVKNYIQKVETWRAFSENTQEELTLLGGKAFPSADVYVGELGTLSAIQDSRLDWNGVRKNFKTFKSYSKEKLMEVVKAESPTPFVYHLDHGNGNQLYAEKEFVASKEISNDKLMLNNRPALMVSVSCSNAAFDELLVNESIYNDSSLGNFSIGTELVRSKAGVPAYLGASRPAVGMPIYSIDDFGNLELTGTNYGLQILESFFQKYGLMRRGRLGDFSLRALRAFVFENGNDLKMDQNAWSYYTTTLLGDPVIPMPIRAKSSENYEIGKSALKLDHMTGVGFPVLRLKENSIDSIPLEVTRTVTASLFKLLEDEYGNYSGEEEVLSKMIPPSDTANLEVDPTNDLQSGNYFLRLENADGVPRERQVYFKVE